MKKLIIVKKILTFMTCSAISAGIITGYTSSEDIQTDVSAKTIAEIQEERRANEAKIAEYETQINSLENDKANQKAFQEALADQIYLIQENIFLLNNELDKLTDEISATEENIRHLDSDIAVQQELINSNIELFKKRLCTMYISGNNKLAEVVLGSASFYDVMSSVEMVNRIASHDEELINKLLDDIDGLEKSKKDLEFEKLTLQTKLEQQAEKVTQKSAEILQLNEKMEQTQEIIDRIKLEQIRLDQSKTDTQKYLDALAQEEIKIEEEIRRHAEEAQRRYEKEQLRIAEEREAQRLEAERIEQERIAQIEQASREQESREIKSRENASREQESREIESRENASREQESREIESRENASREQESREIASREEASRELERIEQASREEASRELERIEQASREEASRELERIEEASRETERQEASRELERIEEASREAERQEASRELERIEEASREAERQEASRELERIEEASREAERQEASRQAEILAQQTTTTTTTTTSTTTTATQTTVTTTTEMTTTTTTTTTIPAPSPSGFLWPTPKNSYISSPFAQRWGTQHKGIDISGTGIMGANVVASKAGMVTYVSNSCTHNYAKTSSCGCGGGYGNYVIIQHDGTYSTLYGHMTSANVSVGDYVQQGDVIGTVGSTGWSTGAHLHFEVRVDGVQQDPLDFVNP